METQMVPPSPAEKEFCDININEINAETQRFQKFIHELFEKNGVLNDLRAYLRGHIVDVLNSAQTGVTPACQKHFTQRLELGHQALNILIAEYLMRLEFGYTLSVFVSELPLANMVFEFSKSLMNRSDKDRASLRFNNNDVWSILNSLGIKCDAEHASLLMKTYKSEEHTPLLLVLLKCASLYDKSKTNTNLEDTASSTLSTASVTSPDKNVKAKSGHKMNSEKCSHPSICKLCQGNMSRLKEKSRRRKHFKRKSKSSIDSLKVCPLMQDIGCMERKLIDEMFEQLKTVYDGEMETLRASDEQKLRQTLTLQALQMHQKRQKLEESFREREKQLEHNIKQKKQFLWGLAKALRDQHAQMSRAMQAVKSETAKLDAKEDSLKIQMDEAQEVLRKRAADMRSKISEELKILEGHVQSMKTERERICRERSELLKLKTQSDIAEKISKLPTTVTEKENDNIRQHYDLLKNELCILKKYLELTKVDPKCVIERSTITELKDVGSKISIVLNNAQELENYAREEDRLSNKLTNQFKKAKNVNFSQPNECNLSEMYLERTPEQRSSDSSIAENNATRQLREENQRLKALAQQQSDQISSLSAQQDRLETLLRSTANQPQRYCFNSESPENPNIPPSSIGCRAGAGEELGLLGNGPPRILVPGDALPFIGVLKDRHNDNRRQAAYAQLWRSRRPASPVSPIRRPTSNKLAAERTESHPIVSAPLSPVDSISTSIPVTPPARDSVSYQPIPMKVLPRERPRAPSEEHKLREKSPKSVLREAKENLRSKPEKPPTTREKSPCSVLREAKARLRKLELEAAAVEKSYFDFRKRQSAMREERAAEEDALVTKDMPELGARDSIQNLDDNKLESSSFQTFPNTDSCQLTLVAHSYEPQVQKDFDNFMSHMPKFNIQESFNKNIDALNKTLPIPQSFPERHKIEDQKVDGKENYLQKPMTEFRKLYNSRSSRSYWSENVKNSQEISSSRPTSPNKISKAQSPTRTYDEFNAVNIEIPTISVIEENQTLNAKKDALKKIKHRKEAEFEILKTNLTKIYNLKDLPKDVSDNKITEECDDLHKSCKGTYVRVRNDIENMDESQENIPADTNKKKEANNETQSESDTEQPIERMHANMTIVISPKRSPINIAEKRGRERKRSISPEQAANLTRNDVLDSIFQKEKSSTGSSDDKEVSHENSAENMEDMLSVDEGRDCNDVYADDDCFDLDDYSKCPEYNKSPTSICETSEHNDSFWGDTR